MQCTAVRCAAVRERHGGPAGRASRHRCPRSPARSPGSRTPAYSPAVTRACPRAGAAAPVRLPSAGGPRRRRGRWRSPARDEGDADEAMTCTHAAGPLRLGDRWGATRRCPAVRWSDSACPRYRTMVEVSSNLNDREPLNDVNTSRRRYYRPRNTPRGLCVKTRTSRREMAGTVAPSRPEHGHGRRRSPHGRLAGRRETRPTGVRRCPVHRCRPARLPRRTGRRRRRRAVGGWRSGITKRAGRPPGPPSEQSPGVRLPPVGVHPTQMSACPLLW